MDVGCCWSTFRLFFQRNTIHKIDLGETAPVKRLNVSLFFSVPCFQEKHRENPKVWMNNIPRFGMIWGLGVYARLS